MLINPALSFIAARFTLAASAAALLALASLHVLCPEFDPSWRMVSEYANGQHGYVLSLMFIFWALSSWGLAVAIGSQVTTTAGKIGLIFLVAAGVGEAMASVFDINHPLHGLSAMIGIPSLAIAAILISMSLARNPTWLASRKLLLWTAQLPWISIVLMAITFAILMSTFTQVGGDMSAQTGSFPIGKTFPAGVIALVGLSNRLLVVMYSIWVMTVAGLAMKIR